MNEALKGISMIANILPNAAALAQPIVIKLLDKMNVSVPPEAKLDPIQLAAKDPRVQQMTLQNMAQANPHIAAVLQQVLSGGQAPVAGGGSQPNQGALAA